MKSNFHLALITLASVFALYFLIDHLRKNYPSVVSAESNLEKESEKDVKPFLTSCLNQVPQIHRHSVWTQLSDRENNHFIKSAVKLLGAIRLHTTIPFDANVVELATKPLTSKNRQILIKAGWRICRLNRIPPRDEGNTVPRFRDTYAKLHLWKMEEYESIVFFDSDVAVIGDVDHLLQIRLNNTVHGIGVTRDIRDGKWQTSFNMGVFVVKPNVSEFERLVKLKNDPNLKYETAMSDQGFLNEVYKNRWYEIGFKYNANLAAYSEQRSYWKEHEQNISVIHFTMSKPWECSKKLMAVCKLWIDLKP